MSITPLVIVDDDGSLTTGTVYNAALQVQFEANINALGGKKELWIPAKDWFPSNDAPCATLALRNTGTPFFDYQHLAFDGAAGEVAQSTLCLPKSWNRGTVTYKVYWSGIAAGAGGVVWRLGGRAMSDNDTYAAAIGTQVDVTDTFIAIDTLHVSAESAAMTIAGTPAVGDVVRLQLNRNPSDAADTRAADANLIGVRLIYTTAAITDD